MDASPVVATDLPLAETRSWLIEHARKRFGRIPPEAISEHVITVTASADFPVRRAALDALHRRMSSVQTEALSVVESPRDGLGRYVLARAAGATPSQPAARREHRPYEIVLESIAPLRGQCTCPDYLKGSLGLCKHLFAAIDFVFEKPKRRDAALAAREKPRLDAQPRLTWDPIIPLVGNSDRLLRLQLENVPKHVSFRGFTSAGRIAAKILDDPKRRLAFLSTLAGTLDHAGAHPTLSAGPSARALVAEEMTTAEREVESLREARVALRHVAGLKRKLYAYQSEGVRRFLERGRMLLADDMGLGKTTQAIAACHALFHARFVRRGLVVTPASLKPQWLREWTATTDAPAVLVDGDARERAEIYRRTATGFLIVNYEIVLRDFELLLPFAKDLVVLDEAQRIKNYATKSAMYVKMLPARRRLVLTGTPMENRFDELASILDWVDDRALAPKWRLAAWHFRHEGDGMNTRTGARNLGTMRERLAPCVVRRLRSDVIDQLPSRTDTRVPVAMTSEQQEEHDALIQPIKALMAIAEKRPLTQPQFLRLMQLLTTQRMISNGLAQVRFDEVWPGLESGRPTRAVLDGLFAPKLDEVRSLIEALVLAQDRKVVIFSQWRRMLKLADWAISDLLASTGRRSLFFTGAESAKLRTQSLVDFHDDPRASVLFLTDAGGVGLNLQHAANACINLELPWNPAVLEQRIGRIYRLGQKRPIDVYNLVAEPGIESRIAAVLATKHAMFKGVFDGTTNDVQFDTAGGFVADVRRIVEIPEAPLVPEEPSASADAPPEDDLATMATNAAADASEAAAPDAAVERVPPGATASAVPADPAQQDAARMLSEVRVVTTPDGGLRIEAPAAAATALATMFDMMARVLRAASTPARSGE